MSKALLWMAALLTAAFLVSGNATAQSKPAGSDINRDEDSMISVDISIGNKVFAALFYENEVARAIVDEMPFALSMNDYASQEKVAGLSFDLPSVSAETPSKIHAGDIYLWSGNSLVLFYTTFSNAYSYVPVGCITDVTGLKEALGSGAIEARFACSE